MEIIPETQGKPLEQIVNSLHLLISNNKQLRSSLMNLDEYAENCDSNLKEVVRSKDEGSKTLRKRLQNEIIVQQTQNKTLSKLLKFAAKQEELLKTQKNDQIEDLAVGYKFLRDQWVRYRIKNTDNLDDRLDLFNKMIAKIKDKTIQKINNVKSENTVTKHDLSAYEMERFSQFQRKSEHLAMQIEDLRCYTQKLEQQNLYLSDHYTKTHTQLQKTKEKLKVIENKFLLSSKKNVQLSNAMSKINDEINTLKRQDKLMYSNKAESLQIEIRYPQYAKGQLQTKVGLEKLIQFLTQDHTHDISSMDIPPVKQTSSSQSIQPVKIFPIEDLGKPLFQINSDIQAAPYNHHPDIKNLRRQSSEGQIQKSSSKILQRTLKYANSVKKIGYVRNKSRDKSGDIERKFYVKLENLDKGTPIT